MSTQTIPSGLDPAIFTKKNEDRRVPLNGGSFTTTRTVKLNSVFGWHLDWHWGGFGWHLGWYNKSRNRIFFAEAGIEKVASEWRYTIIRDIWVGQCNTLESAIQAAEAALVAGAVTNGE